MIFFPNEQIELWEYDENEEDINFWGEKQVGYNLTETVDCDIQPMSPNDVENQFGKILTDMYKIYLNPETIITDTMILRVVGKEDTYTIKGSPLHYNHIIPYIKVIVQKQRQPTKLE